MVATVKPGNRSQAGPPDLMVLPGGIEAMAVHILNADGESGSDGGGGAGVGRALVTTTYVVTAAFTGASIGDTVTATRVIDITGVPSTISTIWRNETTAQDLASVPSIANLEIQGATAITDAELRAAPVEVIGDFTSGGLTDTQLRAAPLAVTGDFASDGLTDVQLRASAVPVSGPLTDAQLRAIDVAVSGTVAVSNTVVVSGPLTNTQLRASAVPVSGPATNAELRATPLAVSAVGPLTNTELRAAPVPVSGTVAVSGALTDAQLRATALPVSGPLTDTQLRATALSVAGPLTDTQIRATPLPVSGTLGVTGPLTDTQLRATALPVSGPLTDAQIRATPLPVSGSFSVTGTLTDTQLRASAVPVSGPLTDAQIRATPLPVSGSFSVTGSLTNTELRASAVPVSGPLTDAQIRATALPVSGTVTATGPLTDTQLRASAVSVSGPLTDTQLRATAVPVSGAVTVSGTVAVSGTVPVSGPLTDTQLRATAVPVSGTVGVSGTVPVSGPLTDAQLRATPVPVSGAGDASAANQLAVTGTKAPGTAAASSGLVGGVYNSAGVTLTTGQQAALQLTSAGLLKTETGALTDTQLRATAVPVSGTVAVTGALTDTQLRATAVAVADSAVTGTKAPGTAAASSGLVGGVYTSAGITLTTGQQAALQLTSSGLLRTESNGLTDTQLRATAVPVSGTLAVTGPLTDSQLRATAVPVSGTVAVTGALTDTQLRAAAVPVSGTVAVTGTLTDTQLRAAAVVVADSAVTGAKAPGTAAASSGLVGGVYNSGGVTLATGQQAALQLDANGVLKVVATGGGDASANNQLAVIGTKAPGTAAISSGLVGGVYNSGGVTLTNGQQAALQLDASGILKVVATGGGDASAANQLAITGTKAPGTAAASSGLVGGVYNSGGVVLTTAQQAALQLTSAGLLRTETDGLTDTQLRATAVPVSGTVAVTGALTDSQLRAAAVPVSGTLAVTGPLTDSQLRAAAVPVSGTVAVTGTLTDAQLRAAAVVVADSAVTGAKAPGTAAASSGLVGGVYNSGGVTLTTGQQAALQLDANGILKVLPTGGGDASAANQLAVTGTKAPGTAAASSGLVGGVYNSGGVTLTNGQQAALQLDASGILKVVATGGGDASAANQLAVTGTKAPGVAAASSGLVGGVYNSGGVTLTTAQQAALQLTSAGLLRTETNGLTDTQLRATAVPVSGTLAVTGPLTDSQLRATAVPVSGTVAVTGALTDTQLRATAVPVSGTVAVTGALTDTQLRAAAVVVADSAVTGTKAPGVAAASSGLVGGVYNSGGVTLTTGQQAALQLDASGILKVVATGGGDASAANQLAITGTKAPGTAATSSGLVGGVYNSGGVTLTTTQQAALQLTSAGLLRTETNGLTDTQLRATAVPVSGTVAVTGALTDTQLRATAVPVSGTVAVTGALTDSQLRATAVPVSGTVTATGPLTDTQLRAAAVPVSGTVAVTGALTDTQLRATAVAVADSAVTGTKAPGTAAASSGLVGGVYNSGGVTLTTTQQAALQLTSAGLLRTETNGLTDTQLRATAVPVSGTVTATGPLTDTQLRLTAVPISGTVTATGPLTDTQLRATAVPISGTVAVTGALTDTQLRATAVPIADAAVTGSKAPGTAAVSSRLTGGVYNSGGVTLTTGQQAALQLDANGILKVVPTGGGDASAANQVTQINHLAQLEVDIGIIRAASEDPTAANVNIIAGTTGITAGVGVVNMAVNTPRIGLASDSPGVVSLTSLDTKLLPRFISGTFNNADIDAEEDVATFSTAGYSRLNFQFATTVALTAFKLDLKYHTSATFYTLANTTAAFTTEVQEEDSRIKNVSGDLTTAGTSGQHWLEMDVTGVYEVRIRAASSSANLTGYYSMGY